MKGNLEESIKQYLAVEDDPHSILLTGGWGSGKTFFAEDKIRKLAQTAGKHYVYIPLFGIESKEEFERALFVRLFPILNGRSRFLSPLLKLLAAKTSMDVRDVMGVWNGVSSDTLLVIDDLERLGDVKLALSVLGVVSNLVHEKKAKAIFIANEAELLSMDDAANYTSWKEKAIRYSYQFKIDAAELVEILGKAFPNALSGLIDAGHAEAIIKNVAASSSCLNLRTYFRSLDQFRSFASRMKDEPSFCADLPSDLLRTILAINVEISPNVEMVAALRTLFNEYNTFPFYSDRTGTNRLINEFLARYFGTRFEGLVRLPHVFHAIVDGVWSSERIREELRAAYSQEGTSPDVLLFRNFRALSQVDFDSAVDRLLQKIYEGGFDKAFDVFKVSGLLFYLSQKKLIDPSPGELRAKLETSVSKMSISAFLDDPSETEEFSLYSSGNEYRNGDHAKFAEFFKETWQKRANERIKAKVQRLVENVDKDVGALIEEMYSADSRLLINAVLNREHANIISRMLPRIQQRDVAKLAAAIEHRYQGGALNSRLASEREFVVNLKYGIEMALNVPDEVNELRRGANMPKRRSLKSDALSDLAEELGEILKDA